MGLFVGFFVGGILGLEDGKLVGFLVFGLLDGDVAGPLDGGEISL